MFEQRSVTLILLAAIGGIFVAGAATGEPPSTPLTVPAGKPPLAPPGSKAPEVNGPGDLGLRGALDLDRLKLEGDHYVSRLRDGRRAVLTLDPRLQRAAEQVLVQAKAPVGAIVVLAKDGRILALAGRRNEAPVRERAPELALSTWAPAASVFKLVTAAALIEGGLSPEQRTCFHGGLRSVESSNLRDDRRDDQCETLGFAVAASQNALIAKLAARRLDRKRLARVARALGFGPAPSFALDAEASRFTVPDGDLEFARMAAGFWSSELSPLGGALLTHTLASGGLRVTPRIVAEIGKGEDRVIVPAGEPERVLDAEVARAVARMMKATCTTGTATKGFHDRRGRRFLKVDVAGKTGSLNRTEPSFLSYSWFVGFAPADDPEITISVVLGNPERWHLKAHTAARLVLDAIY